MTSIRFNLGEVIARRSLGYAQIAKNTASERLATGKQINRAADDPAGLIAARELDRKIIVANKTIASLERQNTFLAAKEGALSAFGEILLDLNSIVVQAANEGGISDEERESLRRDAEELVKAIDFNANSFTFNGNKIAQGYTADKLGSTTVRLEFDDDGDGEIDREEVSTVGLNGLIALAFDGKIGFDRLQQGVDDASKRVATERGVIGTTMNSNDSRIRTLLSEVEGSTAARSLIEDADYAKEVSEQVRATILEQASISTIDVARQQQQAALQLLQSAASIGG